MVRYHRFSLDEVHQATGLSEEEIQKSLDLYGISLPPLTTPPWSRDSLLILPYPGGRHPRIGFLEGAIRPQRETKLSVFTPWDLESYVVIDVPEALWSNLGLTYLAHTHIQTVWEKLQQTLVPLEWEGDPIRGYAIERRLPNGIVFGTQAVPMDQGLKMEMFLFNGSDQPLNDLRVQNCVMLKMAEDFNQLTNDNKLIRNPYVACHSTQGDRWIISAWSPCHRPWTNAPVPCLHSDPKFPDCAPGKTQTLQGWFSFYEGPDIQKELDRLDTLQWWKH